MKGGSRTAGERKRHGDLTIGRWARDRAQVTPDRVAITVFPVPGDANGEGAQAVTYAELDHRSEELAAGLAASGLARGDRVATLTGNCAELPPTRVTLVT